MTERSIEESVRASVEAYNRGDLDGWLDAFAPDCRYQIAPEHPESRLLVGRDEIGEYTRDWQQQVLDLQYRVAEIVTDGDQFLVVGALSGRGADSDLPIEVPLALLGVNRDGQTTSVEEYIDVDRAREDLGSDG
jgi:ketosteroid isomerase-like protein